jgi:hypothetical protein
MCVTAIDHPDHTSCSDLSVDRTTESLYTDLLTLTVPTSVELPGARANVRAVWLAPTEEREGWDWM